MSRPDFLFYGVCPKDWYEGANLGHHYELRFREPPTPQQRAALGERVAQATMTGAVEAGPWLWRGPWALACFGERHIGRFDAFFAGMRALFESLDAIAPLAEVVCWNARSRSDDDWERASLAQQAVPSPGPVYAGLVPRGIFGQARDAALGTPQPDADFDRGRAQAKAPPEPPREPEPTLVQDGTPADLDEAIAWVEGFLDQYTLRDEFYDKGACLLHVAFVAGNDDGGIEVSFGCAGDDGDEALQDLAKRTMAAVERAHPNLGFELVWELSSS